MMGDSNEVRPAVAEHRLTFRRYVSGTNQYNILDATASVWICLLGLALGAAGLSQSVALAKQEQTNLSNEDQFRQVVLPILQKRCFGCHSHGSGVIESELALDFRAGWEKGGSRGPALAPAGLLLAGPGPLRLAAAFGRSMEASTPQRRPSEEPFTRANF